MTRIRNLIAIAWATLVWTSLWGSVSVANLLGGIVIGIATILLVPVAADPRPSDAGRLQVRPLAAASFLLFFLRQLVTASAVVAWEVVTPGSRINQGIVRLPLRTRSPGVTTVIANAISLTPGTLTLEVARDPFVLYVHILHLRGVEEVRADLREVERRALLAFDPEAAELPVPDATPIPPEASP